MFFLGSLVIRLLCWVPAVWDMSVYRDGGWRWTFCALLCKCELKIILEILFYCYIMPQQRFKDCYFHLGEIGWWWRRKWLLLLSSQDERQVNGLQIYVRHWYISIESNAWVTELKSCLTERERYVLIHFAVLSQRTWMYQVRYIIKVQACLLPRTCFIIISAPLPRRG